MTDQTIIEQVRGIVNDFLQARLAMDVSNYQITCVSEEIANAVLATLQSSAVLPSEAMHDAMIAAYRQGAQDVHEHWAEANTEAWAYLQRQSYPDFTEAAHDYADTAMRATTPTEKG